MAPSPKLRKRHTIKRKCSDCKRPAKVYCMLTKLWWCVKCFKVLLKDTKKPVPAKRRAK